MKKNGAIFMFALICLCLIFGKTSVKAYVIGENEPKITEIQFLENGKILKTGDTLHVTLKTENVDCDTYYKCRVLFTAHIGYRVDDITIECTYNPSTGFYQGESVPILKEEKGETKYDANFYGFYNEHPGIYGEVLSTPALSFVYSDNCYAGIHTGGEARCNQLARCKICQSEYGELGPHTEGEWEIIKNPTYEETGKKEKRCKYCFETLESEIIPALEAPVTPTPTLTPTPTPTPAEAVKLTGKSMEWTSYNSAKITCVANKDGWYYVGWVTRGSQAPTFDLEKEGVPVQADREFVIYLEDLDSEKAIDVYVRVKDKDNNASKKMAFKLDEKKRPPAPTQSPSREPIVPMVTESVVQGLENPLEFHRNTFYDFTVIGAGTQNNDPIQGDVKWVPLYWSLVSNPFESQKHTTWKIGAANGITQAATYNLYVFFQKYEYDGANWQATNTIESATYQFQSKEIVLPTPTPTAAPEPPYYPIYTPTATPTPAPTATPTPTVTPTPIPEKKDASDFVVSEIPTQKYSPFGVRPSVTVKYKGEKLRKFFDYIVVYDNHWKPGKAECAIYGLGEYSGVKVINFNIAPKQQKIISLNSNKNKTATIKFKKVTGQSGVQICYSTDKNFKKSKSVYTTATSKTIAKLSKNKTYYFKIRAYVNIDGKKVYGAYSKVQKVKVK